MRSAVFSDIPGNAQLDHLRSIAQPTPFVAIECMWSTVELQPDIFVRQAFSVGVVVQSPNSKAHYKLISDFRKMTALYGNCFEDLAIAELIQHASEVLLQFNQNPTTLEDVNFRTCALRLSPPFYSSGDSVEAILGRLYDEVIVVDPLHSAAGNAPFSQDNNI